MGIKQNSQPRNSRRSAKKQTLKILEGRNLPLTPLNSARATVAGSRRVFPMGRAARTDRDSKKANRSLSYEKKGGKIQELNGRS